MKYEITVYNFFRTADGGADYVNNEKLVHLSADMLACMLNQYKIMGFRTIFDCDSFVSVSKVENEIEIFCEKLAKRG